MGGGILMKRQNPADEWIREMAANESWEAPKSCRDHTEQILAALSDSPDKEEHMRIVFRKRTLILAAALAALVEPQRLPPDYFNGMKRRWKILENQRKRNKMT